MATIINFTAKLNELRAAAKIAVIETAREEKVNAKMAEAAEQFRSGNIFDSIDSIVEAQEAAKPVSFGPCAYCDPRNEYKGSKYEATRGLNNVEVAKLMREDIKDAKKRGQIPKDMKISVVVRHHTCIDMSITSVPVGIAVFTPEYLEATGNLSHPSEYGQFNYGKHEEYSPVVAKALTVLDEIHNSYQRDNSDSMSDYFDVRYYGSVGVDWEVRQAAKI